MKRIHLFRNLRALCIGLIALAWLTPVAADPPPHAKAHGWRKKNDPTYAGYEGKKWERDYGVVSLGRCDTDAVLGVAGAAIGGIVGAQASQGADDSQRAIAVIVGSAVGAVIGSKIGREVDRTDQACMGHALELTGLGKTVRWENQQVRYALTPIRNLNSTCREFKLDAVRSAVSESVKRVACSTRQGIWELRP